MNKTTKIKSEEGTCPMCGEHDLNYEGALEFIDDYNTLHYNYTCNSCKFEGQEWYSVNFTDHTDADGNDM